MPDEVAVRGARLLRHGLIVALAALACACSQRPQPVAAVEPGPGTACAVDGMLLLDFPGPKGQIHYEAGEPEFFCDTMELLSALLRPEQQRAVRAAMTQDMAQAEWKKPVGHWIDARAAFYVLGSDRKGSMGATAASFAQRPDAEAFASQHGGKVYAYAQIKPDMVALDGGVIRDEKM
jgi:copper chaperone NosL